MKRAWLLFLLPVLVCAGVLYTGKTPVMLDRATLHAQALDGQEALCANTWVIVCDNFEARAPGGNDLTRATFKNGGWQLGYSPPSTAHGFWYVDNGTGLNGSRSVRVDCGPHGPGPDGIPGNGDDPPRFPGDPDDSCGSFIAMYHSAGASVRTLYFRWYARWATSSQDWRTSPIAEKHLIIQYSSTIDGKTQGAHTGAGGSGGQPQRFAISHVFPDAVYDQNTGPTFVRQDNTWYCYEAKITLGSGVNTSDGSLEMWIDGVQRHLRNNVATTAFPSMNWAGSQTLFSAYLNCITDDCRGAADYKEVQSRFHDNWVVGTQRIGCIGSTPPPVATDQDGDGFLDDGSDFCPTQPGGPPNGCPTVPPPTQSQEPISEWNFEEATGTVAADTSARNPLTLVNGPTHIAGMVGTGAIQYDGVNDHAFNGNLSGMPTNEGVQSFCSWFNWTAPLGDDKQVLTLGGALTNAYRFLGFNTAFAPGGVMSFGVFGGVAPNGAVVAWFARTSTLPAAGVKHEACYTWDGTTHRLYVDGAEAASQVGPIPQSGPTQEIAIAGYPFPTGVGRAFNVKVDRTRVWNRVLTPAEIAASFNDTLPPPTSVIKIDRVGADGLTTTAPAPTMSSALDNGPLTAANPADFANLAAATNTYRAQVVDNPGYIETFGMCSYVVGASECTVSSWPTTPTCDGTRCSTALISTFGNEVTRVSFKYTLIPVTSAPSNIILTQITDTTQVRLNWLDNANNETGQRIERQESGGAFNLLATVGADIVTYLDTSAVGGVTYGYRIRAENAAGNSAFSPVVSITTSSVTNTPPPTVSGVSVSSIPLDTPTTTVLTGTNFVAGATLMIENNQCAAANIVYTSATSISFQVVCPVGATVGSLDLTVTNPDGDAVVLTNAFTVSGAVNLRTRKLTWTWDESAISIPDAFSVRWGTASLGYSHLHPPIAFSSGSDIGTQRKFAVSLLELFGTAGTYYLVIVPVYGASDGAFSPEQVLVVADSIPPDTPGNIGIE